VRGVNILRSLGEIAHRTPPLAHPHLADLLASQTPAPGQLSPPSTIDPWLADYKQARVCMCVCVYVRMCVYACVCACVSAYVCEYVCACASMCVCVCACVHVCVRACVRACACARVIASLQTRIHPAGVHLRAAEPAPAPTTKATPSHARAPAPTGVHCRPWLPCRAGAWTPPAPGWTPVPPACWPPCSCAAWPRPGRTTWPGCWPPRQAWWPARWRC